MRSEEIFIDKDGFLMHAAIDIPEDKRGKIPMVLMVHGLTGYKEEWHLLGIRDSVIESGFSCMRIDLYGHGKTAGAFYNHNLLEWVSEILYVIDYARKLPYVSDVILAGHSQGGLAVLLAAGIKVEQVKALLLLSPALNIPGDCRKGEFFDATYDPKKIPEHIDFWDGHLLGENYFRIARTIDFMPAVKTYTGPVLIIHGGEDGAVLPQYSKDIVSEFANGKLRIIEGDGHCYEHHLDCVKSIVKEFLQELSLVDSCQ